MTSDSFRRFIHWNVLWSLILVATLSAVAMAQPQQRSTEPRTHDPEEVQRIIILGTTIIGSVARPRVVYELPWKTPDTFDTAVNPPQRSFFQEIFRPIDKETFESQFNGTSTE